jgi:hypothetical protein
MVSLEVQSIRVGGKNRSFLEKNGKELQHFER